MKVIALIVFLIGTSNLVCQTNHVKPTNIIDKEVFPKRTFSRTIIKAIIEDERIVIPDYNYRKSNSSFKYVEKPNRSSEISLDYIYGLIDSFFEGESGVTMDEIFMIIDKYFEQ